MKGTPVQNAAGELHIWSKPEQGRTYAIGVDTSSGVRGGDLSVAEVIDMETCEQVAEWRGYVEPTAWGFRVARLGWHYNEAPVAFETHPSPHGLTAHMAAERYGYQNLWLQEKWDAFEQKFILRKGWVRTPNSTLQLYDRAKEHLGQGVVIHSQILYEELKALHLKPNPTTGILDKIGSKKHDDSVVAWCIALWVRDDAFVRGVPQSQEQREITIEEAYWQRKNSERTTEKRRGPRFWDGT